jgi:putative transposase
MRRTPTRDLLSYKSFYRRNLPHLQPSGATLFVTFRLSGSLPQRVLARMAADSYVLKKSFRLNDTAQRSLTRRYFAILEACLDRAESGPTWLANPAVADVIAEALHYRDGKQYRLDAFSIMPNHVHAVFAPLMNGDNPEPLSSIMHSLKRKTAKDANEVLNRSGHFWQHETFDHYVRDGAEWRRIIEYVLNNPVKASLVTRWQDWRWNYVSDRLLPARPS